MRHTLIRRAARVGLLLSFLPFASATGGVEIARASAGEPITNATSRPGLAETVGVITPEDGWRRVDPEVIAAGQKIAAALKKAGAPLLPRGAKLSVWAEDGRVLDWGIELTEMVDFAALGRAAGIKSTDRAACATVFAEQLVPKVIALSTKEVASACTDANFNPEVDVAVRVYGHFLKPPRLRNGKPDDFFHVSYTGTQREPPPLETGGRRNIIPGAVIDNTPTPPAKGGTLWVTLEPDRTIWDRKESITGRVTIANMGDKRIHLDAWHATTLVATDIALKEAKAIPLRGFIDPAPGSPQYIFLLPGQKYVARFDLCTDPEASLRTGYEIPAGPALLHLWSGVASNLRIIGSPARVTVR